MIRIGQLISREGKTVANHLVSWTDDRITFQSYETIICHVVGDKITLDPNWTFSKTTTKYLCHFLEQYANIPNLNKAKVQKMIDGGKFEVKDLN